MALILIGGGYYLSRSGRWCRLLPDRALLMVQGDENAPATSELFRRYAGGSLSAEHAARMFDQAMLAPRIQLLKSLPAGFDTAMQFQTYLQVPGGFTRPQWTGPWSAVDELSELRIDDEPVPRSLRDAGDNTIWRLLDKDAWRCYPGRLPSLPPGRHTVSWTKVFALWRKPPAPNGTPLLLHRWKLTAFATITVDEQPPEAHVRAMARPEHADEIRQRLQIPDYEPNVDVGVGDVPYESYFQGIAVAGEMWWRPSGSGPYRRSGELCLPRGYSSASSLRFPMGGPQGQSCVDIRVIPSAKVAVENGCSEYFGDVIELLNVPVAVVKGQVPRAPQPPEIRFLHLADVVVTPAIDRAAPENRP